MEQVFYTSVAAAGVDAGDVFKIMQHATERNRQRDLTGFLAFAHGRFFQVIEGPESEVSCLLQTLARDPRHHSLKILRSDKVASRQFGHWRMKRLVFRNIPEAREEFERILSKRGGIAEIVREYNHYLKLQNATAVRRSAASPAARPSSPRPYSRPSTGAPSL